MTVLVEGDLQITLPPNANGRKFDDKSTHGLSHCMKAVDFIIELADRVLFVEIKDCEHPRARQKNSEDFFENYYSGKLDNDLKTKYRDSFLYEWASGNVGKPIYYYVLIAASFLTAADLLTRTDALQRQIPRSPPHGKRWNNPLVSGCAVMNLASWNKALPQFPVSRIGS